MKDKHQDVVTDGHFTELKLLESDFDREVRKVLDDIKDITDFDYKKNEKAE